MPNTTVSGIVSPTGPPERYFPPATGVLDTSYFIVTYPLMVPLIPTIVPLALRNNAEWQDQNPSFATPAKLPPGQTSSVPAYAAPPAAGGINNPPNGEVAKATGASSGTPGAWIPSGITAPYSILDAPAATNPATAWPTLNYIVCRDKSEISWNGTKWLPGRRP
jgi:hypothetical protein